MNRLNDIVCFSPKIFGMERILHRKPFCKGIEHYGHQTELNAALLKRIAHNVWSDRLKKQNREIVGTVPETFSDEVILSIDIVKMLSLLTPKQSVFHIEGSVPVSDLRDR
jgi:hypothetical protein